jgi:hypothetical protein
MKNLLPRISKMRISIVKKLPLILIVAGILMVPDQLLHYLLVLTHAVYEGCALLLEEILIHTLDINKFYAQLIIFYLSCSVGLLVLVWLYRKLSVMIPRAKNRLLDHYLQYKTQLIQAWHHLSWVQKIKILIFQFAAMIGVFALLLA